MKKHTAPIIAAVLLLLPLLYVATYLTLVKRGPSATSIVLASGQRETRVTNYRVGSGGFDWFFWPLEQVDRQLRQAAWKKRLRGGVYLSP